MDADAGRRDDLGAPRRRSHEIDNGNDPHDAHRKATRVEIADAGEGVYRISLTLEREPEPYGEASEQPRQAVMTATATARVTAEAIELLELEPPLP